LMDFENDFLNMDEKMIPLLSSYTATTNSSSSGEKNSSSKKNSNNQSAGQNITNEGGRPELPDEEKSEKTQNNIATKG